MTTIYINSTANTVSEALALCHDGADVHYYVNAIINQGMHTVARQEMRDLARYVDGVYRSEAAANEERGSNEYTTEATLEDVIAALVDLCGIREIEFTDSDYVVAFVDTDEIIVDLRDGSPYSINSLNYHVNRALRERGYRRLTLRNRYTNRAQVIPFDCNQAFQSTGLKAPFM